MPLDSSLAADNLTWSGTGTDGGMSERAAEPRKDSQHNSLEYSKNPAGAGGRRAEEDESEGELCSLPCLLVPEWACKVFSDPWGSEESQVLRALAAACKALGLETSGPCLSERIETLPSKVKPHLQRKVTFKAALGLSGGGGSSRALAHERNLPSSSLLLSTSRHKALFTRPPSARALLPGPRSSSVKLSVAVVKPLSARNYLPSPTAVSKMRRPSLTAQACTEATLADAVALHDTQQELPGAASAASNASQASHVGEDGSGRQLWDSLSRARVDLTTKVDGGVLRAMFIAQALSYVGTPYLRLASNKGTKHATMPSLRALAPAAGAHTRQGIALDCSALIRQCLYDLRQYFGFVVGGWNQCYQYDTLPLAAEKIEDLKPGDLVFISGEYFDQNRKKKPHNLTHVEIYFPCGFSARGTIGSRHKHGCVQVHEDFAFESKTYHSMQYHFRRIDTWLDGECRSHCTQHRWQTG